MHLYVIWLGSYPSAISSTLLTTLSVWFQLYPHHIIGIISSTDCNFVNITHCWHYALYILVWSNFYGSCKLRYCMYMLLSHFQFHYLHTEDINYNQQHIAATTPTSFKPINANCYSYRWQKTYMLASETCWRACNRQTNNTVSHPSEDF